MDLDEAFNLVLSEIPDYEPSWKEYLNEWNRATERGSTNDFSHFAHFVENSFEVDLNVVSNLIEKFLTEGNEDLTYGVKFGFLENLTNDPKNNKDVINCLGPRAKQLIKELDGFWGTKSMSSN